MYTKLSFPCTGYIYWVKEKNIRCEYSLRIGLTYKDIYGVEKLPYMHVLFM